MVLQPFVTLISLYYVMLIFSTHDLDCPFYIIGQHATAVNHGTSESFGAQQAPTAERDGEWVIIASHKAKRECRTTQYLYQPNFDWSRKIFVGDFVVEPHSIIIMLNLSAVNSCCKIVVYCWFSINKYVNT